MLPAKLRYSRRVWGGVAVEGWSMPVPGMSGSVPRWARGGRFCMQPKPLGPRRGRNSERRFPGAELPFRGVAFITPVIITVLPGTARTRHSRLRDERRECRNFGRSRPAICTHTFGQNTTYADDLRRATSYLSLSYTIHMQRSM